MAPKQHSSVGIIGVAKGIHWVPESASGIFMGLCAHWRSCEKLVNEKMSNLCPKVVLT